MQSLNHMPAWVRLVAMVLGPWLRRVPLPAESIDRLRHLHERGKVVLLMRSANWIDYLVWWSLARRARIPGPSMVFGLGSNDTPATDVPSGSLVFLKDTQEAGADPIERLLVQLREGANTEVALLPVTILWSTKPRSMERSLVEIVLGPHEQAGWLRRVLWLLSVASTARVLVGAEIKLHEFAVETRTESLATVVRKLRLTVRYHLAGEERSVRGPRLVPRRRLIERVLRDAKLQQVIRDVAAASGKPQAAVQQEAEKMLDEVAADFTWGAVRFLEFVLTRVWSRIYEDMQIDLDGLERVREAAKVGPVVLIPSHKSHVDYLILSYVFKINNMVPPHIAAGINLNFFPLGPLFRRCGAFFIRRSFVGDTLYETVLKTYIKVLLKEHYNIEFFIEGTRSRSGKLMAPKFGMLGMIHEAVEEIGGDALSIVPVSIDYESLVEESAMVREAAGGEKQAEGVGGLLKARRTLARKYGSVYLKFHEPIAWNTLAKRHAQKPPFEQVKGIAYDVLDGIQKMVTVTSTALVATAIASHHKRGIRRPTMLKRIALLEEIVQRAGGRLASDFLYGTLDPERALKLLLSNRVVRLIEIQGEQVYSVDDGQRMALDYYKNNIVHYLVNASFAATAFRVSRDDTFASLWEGYRGLHEVFAEEFHRVGRPPDEAELRRELSWFCERGLVACDGDRYRVLDTATLMSLENITRNFLESFYIAVITLLEAQPRDMPREIRDWLRLAFDMGELLYARGDIWRIESRSKVNLTDAINSFRHSGLLTEAVELKRAGRRSTRAQYRVAPDAKQRLEAMRDLLGRILVEVQL